MNVGRYEVIRELGRGGMAVVYLARDPFMKRQVAVKVLPHQFTFDPQFRTRFQREAEVIAALEHPNIVPVYDFGEHDGQPFIVMRFMPGGTLADRLAKVSLPLPEIGVILERIGAALDYAHSQGVIHRDIKPVNILFDSQEGAFLSDFGIAKLAGSTSTFTGAVIIGTPEYMSPEQARGEQKLDGRSDIYSLGVMLFQAISGQLPFKADTPIGIAVAHNSQPVPSLLKITPGLTPGVETVVRRSLEKDPAQRYQTAGELAQAFSRQATQAAHTSVAGLSTIHATPAGAAQTAAGGGPKTPAASDKSTQEQRAAAQNVPLPPTEKVRPFPVRWVVLGGAALLLVCLGIVAAGFFASVIFSDRNAIGRQPAPTQSGATAVALLTPIETPALPATNREAPTSTPAGLAMTPTPEPTTASPPATHSPTLPPRPTGTPAPEPPLFTARENMFCRRMPDINSLDTYDILSGESYPVLGRWSQDPNWLLLGIDDPANTRSKCCWVSGIGDLNASPEAIPQVGNWQEDMRFTCELP
jgi:serine/threonine-protein kinase